MGRIWFEMRAYSATWSVSISDADLGSWSGKMYTPRGGTETQIERCRLRAPDPTGVAPLSRDGVCGAFAWDRGGRRR